MLHIVMDTKTNGLIETKRIDLGLCSNGMWNRSCQSVEYVLGDHEDTFQSIHATADSSEFRSV